MARMIFAWKRGEEERLGPRWLRGRPTVVEGPRRDKHGDPAIPTPPWRSLGAAREVWTDNPFWDNRLAGGGRGGGAKEQHYQPDPPLLLSFIRSPSLLASLAHLLIRSHGDGMERALR